MMRKISTCGILSSLAIVLGTLEQFVPIQSIIPLPGVKLGIANCIILFSIYKLGVKYSFAIMLVKSFVISMLFSGFSSLIYSVFGGILSLVVMFVLKRFGKLFSIYGVSVAGAMFHNIGQILAASVMLGSLHIFNYLPVLLLVSVFTGLITGFISDVIITRIR